jgi:hypothetical protein
MRTHTAAVLLALVPAACTPAQEQACLVWPHDAQPVALDDSVQLRVWTVVVSDCDATRPRPAVWHAVNPAVATVSAGGVARGVTPGVFRAVAVAGADTLRAEGFVLPRGWRARLTPESATVRVGDTVAFHMLAVDSAGGALPPVPFSLYTPEFLAIGREAAAGVSPGHCGVGSVPGRAPRSDYDHRSDWRDAGRGPPDDLAARWRRVAQRAGRPNVALHLTSALGEGSAAVRPIIGVPPRAPDARE